VCCSPSRLQAGVFVAAILLLPGCSRRAGESRIERFAILRFENFSGDASLDWMGRAFSEVITAALSGVPGVHAISSARLHAFNPALGIRSVSTPGISSERVMALAAQANRIGYGEYSVRGGRLEARLTIEDPRSGKMIRVVTASAPTGDVIAAGGSLARQLSDRAAGFGTRNGDALKAWTLAVEARDAGGARQALEHAIAADPDFAPPYRSLAQLKAQSQDREGARTLLEQALARGNRLPDVERARISVDLATLRGDGPAAQRALADLVRVDPGDPHAWNLLAQTAMGRRDYRTAVGAFERALGIEPDNVNTYNQLGYAAAYAGEDETAVRALRRYQALRPTDPNALDSLGDVHLIAGRLREAEGFYLEAAKKDPNFLNHAGLFKAAMARLMTGDVAGADALAKQYTHGRAAAGDPLAGYQRAAWSWIAGRRKAGYQDMAAFASTAQPEAASRAYSQLAIWSLLMGDRAAAAEMAQRTAAQAGPASIGISVVARFLAQPSASAAEWTARAERLFPVANSARDLTLAYALLLEKQFQPAAVLLKRIHAATGPSSDESLPVLLAWTLVETGRTAEAAPLLAANPVPPPSGVGPMMSFYFPRLYYLRGVAGDRASLRLFLQLSGPDPLVWGEEEKARGQ
jgi:Flp pilus assembly protein TadD